MYQKDQYGYLPSLEEVGTSATKMLVIAAAYGSFSALFAGVGLWGYLKYHEFFTPTQSIIALLMPALVCWIVVRMLFSYLRYFTSTNGITLWGPVRRRTIAWIDIEKAWTTQSKASGTALWLQTRSGRTKIIANTPLDTELLAASVRQYLNPLGRADGVELGERAKTLWQPIPDTIPEEIIWGKPPTRGQKAAGWFGVLFFAALIAPAAIYFGHGLFGWLMRILFVAFAVGMARFGLVMLRCLAYEVKVDRSGVLGITAVGSVRMEWAEVSTAGWATYGQTTLSLTAAVPKRQLRIPLIPGRKESEELALAVIRHLRAAGLRQPISLPPMISQDPSVLNKPTLSSHMQAQMQMAYINTLPEAARKRLGRLRIMFVLIMLLGVCLGFLPMVYDPISWLSLRLHRQDAAFYISCNSLPLAVPVVILGILAFGALGNALGARLAGPYKEEWRKLQSVGSSKKANKVAAWILIGLIDLSVIAAVLMVNSYVKVSDTGIAVRGIGAMHERRYGWQDVKDVRVVSRYVYSKNGGHESTTYTISFHDSSNWGVRDLSSISVPEPEVEKMLQFVAAKADTMVEREYLDK